MVGGKGGDGGVQRVQVRCPDMTASAVLNLYTQAAQVVGRLRQAWMQSHASVFHDQLSLE